MNLRFKNASNVRRNSGTSMRPVSLYMGTETACF